MADAVEGAGRFTGVEPHAQIRRAFSVETQTEFDALTKTVEHRVFIKVYAYARTSGLIAALGPCGWQTLSVLATYMDADGNCFPSQSEIADALKITRQAANERLRELLAFRWAGKPILMACKVRGDGQKFANTRYTILPVTGFRFGPDQPDEAMSSGGDMDDTQAMSIADDMGDAGAMSSADDTNKIHGLSAVLPIEGESTVTSSSGNPVPETSETEVNIARAQGRDNSTRMCAREKKLNTTRAKTPPNPDVRPLLLRHAQRYQERVGAPYPVAWGKEGAIIKRLLQTYTRDELVLLQDTFFGQPADSQAALRGYTVQRLEHEAPALMSRIKLREHLSDEQREAVAALRNEGVSEETALALAVDHPAPDIRRQIRALANRKERLRNPAAALVKAIRENWEAPEEDEPAYYRPLPPAAPEEPLVPAPPEVEALLQGAIAHLTGKGK